jgi:hypothetical protein
VKLRVELLSGIEGVSDAMRYLENELEDLMIKAKKAGATDRQIARSRGVTAQAVYQWFERRRNRG